MEGLPDHDDSSRKRFRLLVIAVVILAIALIAAIAYGSIRHAFATLLADYAHVTFTVEEFGMQSPRSPQYMDEIRDEAQTEGSLMATGSNAVLRDFQTLFQLGTTASQSDAELLGHFMAQSGEQAEIAFAAVVARHGPMVLRGVCRRIVSDPLDAEDAFQVTFLVLARKARAIARRDSLANWLYGVAVRTAREVRSTAARRRQREGLMKERLRKSSDRRA